MNFGGGVVTSHDETPLPAVNRSCTSGVETCQAGRGSAPARAAVPGAPLRLTGAGEASTITTSGDDTFCTMCHTLLYWASNCEERVEGSEAGIATFATGQH